LIIELRESSMEKIEYRGWENCYRLSNDVVDLIVTADVGPRIIRFGFVDGENEFYEDEALWGRTGGDAWVNYGGHRLWHAPEARPRTYASDNDPVAVEVHKGFVRFAQPVERSTGIRKEMDVWLDPRAAHVRVVHRLRNANLWPVELAPWALSVMAQGGTGILPLPPRGAHEEHLLPTGSLALWAYTDMADPRWTWGSRYVLLRQDPRAETAQKVGLAAPDGWAAYARDGHLFVVTFPYLPTACYPDRGSNAELFTNDAFLEVETLGPLSLLAPGDAVEHVEEWYLFDGVPQPRHDAGVDEHLMPEIAPLLS
jgi:hypothetical protein